MPAGPPFFKNGFTAVPADYIINCMKRLNKDLNAAQRKNILAVARRLFYDNGYQATYLDHIAAECGITKQLIAYYFESKAGLAFAVDDQIASEIKNTLDLKTYRYYYDLKDYDLRVNTALEIKLESLMYLHDKKALRFYRELCYLDPGNSQATSQDTSHYYRQHMRQYKLDIDDSRDEFNMLMAGVYGAGTTLLINYADGKFRCTEEQFLDYSVEVLYKFMNLSREEIREINRKSNEILRSMEFRFEPYFHIL